MTDPDIEIERQLKAALDTRAEHASHVDLADAALHRAGRIRARRRIATGVAALAVVALAVPVGAQLIDAADRRAPSASDPTDELLIGPVDAVDVAIGGLATGSPPAVPHLSGTSYFDGSSIVELQPVDKLRVDAAPLDDGLLVFDRDDAGKIHYAALGGASQLPVGSESSNPAIDGTDGSVAFAVRTDSADTLVLTRSLASVEGTASTGTLKVQQVMGVKQGEIVFNAREGSHRVVGRVNVLGADSTVEQPWEAVATVTAIDPEFTRVAAVLSPNAGGTPSCASMLEYDNANEEWQSCVWRPVEFSGDGTRVLAVGSDTDGLGPREIAVLDAGTGEVIQQFSTKGTFGRLTFEDPDTVIGVVNDDGQSAIVRCTVGGECELATDPATVVPDEPSSLLTPYQITAN